MPNERYWRLPWHHIRRGHQRFWELYVERSLDGLNSTQALKRLVPFAIRLGKCEADWLAPGHAWVEGFFYPHRVVAAVWVYLEHEAGLTLDQLNDKIIDARKAKKYRVTWYADGQQGELSLYDLALEARRRLRQMVLAGAPVASDDDRPFVITTVTKGSYDEEALATAIDPGGPIHQALEVMCLGERPVNLHNLAASLLKIDMDQQLPSQAHYAVDRARAGWFPARFRRADDKLPLGCYHRNLTYASLQTDALIEMLNLVSRIHDQGRPIPDLELDLALAAAGLVRLLYGKNKEIYQSDSVRKQIDQRRGMIDPILAFLGKPPLSPPPEPDRGSS